MQKAKRKGVEVARKEMHNSLHKTGFKECGRTLALHRKTHLDKGKSLGHLLRIIAPPKSRAAALLCPPAEGLQIGNYQLSLSNTPIINVNPNWG